MPMTTAARRSPLRITYRLQRPCQRAAVARDLLKHSMLKVAGGVLWQAANRMFEDDAFPLAAALAYYSLLSMAPLLLVAVAVAGIFFADGQVQAQLVEEMRRLIGEAGAALTQTVIAHTGNEQRSAWSLAVG